MTSLIDDVIILDQLIVKTFCYFFCLCRCL